jgi:hypothetical protein
MIEREIDAPPSPPDLWSFAERQRAVREAVVKNRRSRMHAIDVASFRSLGEGHR